MATTTTAEGVIRSHADGIAYVTEETPATDLDTFIGQLGTAAERFEDAGINGHEDVETAAALLGEVRDDSDGAAFLNRAGELLRNLSDMTDEYRSMVGD